MKNKKRWLAGLLAVILIMNTFVGSALAKSEDGGSTQSAAEQEVQTKESTTEAEKTTTEESKSETSTKSTEKKSEERQESTQAKIESSTTTEEKITTKTTRKQTKTVFQKVKVQSASKTTIPDELSQKIFGVSYDQFEDLGKSDEASGDYVHVYVNDTSPAESVYALGSEQKPYTSIYNAFSGQKAAGKKGIIVHLMSGYKETLDNGWSNSSIPAIIVSDNYGDDNAAVLHMTTQKWNFQENIAFYNVDLSLEYGKDADKATIFANGHKAVFGTKGKNNFKMTKTNAAVSPTLFGAGSSSSGTSESHSKVDSTHLEVYSGSWAQIFGGGEYYSDVTGTATVIVNGYQDGTDNNGGSSAINFDDSSTYMEGANSIVAGGAGYLQLNVEASYSHVDTTDLQVSYVTTPTGITPNGGWVETKGEVVVNHTTMKKNGVNARAQGTAGDTTYMTLNDCVVTSGCIGNIGDNDSGISKKYRFTKTIKDLKVELNRTNLKNGILSLKRGNLNKDSYDNAVEYAEVKMMDSYAQDMSIATIPCAYQSGTCKIDIENSKENYGKSCWGNFVSGADFSVISELKLVGIGTQQKPVQMKDYFLAGTYTGSGSYQRKAVIDHSYIQYQRDWKYDELSLTDSTLTLNKNVTLAVNKSYTASGDNKIIVNDNSKIKLTGKGNGEKPTKIQADNLTENAQANISWNYYGNKADKTLFEDASSAAGITSKSDQTVRLCLWQWKNGEIKSSGKQYIYLDGELGHDDINEYETKEDSATLGYDKQYPVKTLEKAYELVNDQTEAIILSGEYSFKSSTIQFLDETKTYENWDRKKSVKISSADDLWDYRNAAYFSIPGTANLKGSFFINAAFNFDDIRFVIQDNPAGEVFYCNGYDTIFGKNVSMEGKISSGNTIFAGSKTGNIDSTNLTIKCEGFRNVYATGESGCTIGSEENEGKVTLNYEVTPAQFSTIGILGTINGDADIILKLPKVTTVAGNSILFYQDNTRCTINGTLTTQIAECTIATIGGRIAPVGKCKDVKWSDETGNTDYSNLQLGKTNIETLDATYDCKSMSQLQMYSDETEADKMDWTISCKNSVRNIIGSDNNTSVKALNLTLKKGDYNIITTKSSSSEINGDLSENADKQLTFDGTNDQLIDRIDGFESILAKNKSDLAVVSAIQTDKLAVENSRFGASNGIQVGNENKNNGLLAVGENSYLTMNDGKLLIYGNVEGSSSDYGTIENNGVDENGDSNDIVVTGDLKDKIYFTTGCDIASLKVMNQTTPDQVSVPPDDERLSINYDKDEEEAEQRTWTVTNKQSKRYIYVDGTINSDSEEYKTHDGRTPEKAFKTLQEAYDEVLNHGYIVICGNLNMSSWPTNAIKSVTITGKVDGICDYYSDHSIKVQMKQTLEMTADTTFEYLNIEGTGNIGACGHKVVMGHKDDADSLYMLNKINIAGGGWNKLLYKLNTDLTIYSGKYNEVVGGQYTYGVYSSYSSIKVGVHGGELDSFCVKNDLHENFTNVNSIDVVLDHCKINNSFQIMKHDYTVGRVPYNIKFGEGLTFNENASVYFGQICSYGSGYQANITIDGGEQGISIPKIYCGATFLGGDPDKSQINLNIKNATIKNFYGGTSLNNTNESLLQGTSNITLNENTNITKFYFGGVQYPNKNVNVTIKSPDVSIESFSGGCENDAAKTPQTSVLNYENAGTKDEVYKLTSGISWNGIKTVNLKNSFIDITNLGSKINLGDNETKGTLGVDSESGLTGEQHNLTISGNYNASTQQGKPSLWYGKNAMNLTFDGKVSGTTKMIALDNVTGYDRGVFASGLKIKATHSDEHMESNFIDCKEESIPFSTGTETDTWQINDQTDTPDRTQVYVSEDGVDSNAGTMSAPVKTLYGAFEKIDKQIAAIQNSTELSEDEKSEKLKKLQIVLLTDINITTEDSTEVVTSEYPVTIMSADAEKPSGLVFDSEKSFSINRILTLSDLAIKSSRSVTPEIYANGYPVTIEKTVTSSCVTGFYPALYGGSENSQVTSTNLTVKGGSWAAIYGGGKSKNATVTGNVKITSSDNISMTDVGTYNMDTMGIFGGGNQGAVKGKITMNIQGGNYLRIHGGGQFQNAETKDIELNYQGGTTRMLYGGGQYAQAGNIKVTVGKDTGSTAKVTSIYRGGGMNAGLEKDCTSTTVINHTAVLQPEADSQLEFAAGGYSGSLDGTQLDIKGGNIDCDIFAGGWGDKESTSYGRTTKTQLNITGGTIKGNVFAGGNMGYVGSGQAQDKDLSTVSLKGGTITGNIYGGCNIATTYGNTDLTIEGSSVKGNVYGGGKGTDDTAAEITGTTNVKVNGSEVDGNIYGGCDTNGTVTNTKVTAIVLPNGNLFAGGYGEKTKVTDTANLTLKASDTEDKTNKFTAYGGGEKGIVKKTQVNADNWNGDIFAGGKGELKTKNRLGRALLRIFTESDLIDANVSETNVNVTGTVTGDIFAGGEFATVGTTNESADKTELSKKVSNVTIAGTVNGKVYGGGKGEKDKNYAAINGSTNVTLTNGGNVTVSGHAENAKTGVIFGGGQNAPVAGNTNVNVTDGTYSTIFGGNDVSGEIQGNTNVNITGAKTEHAYGAGRDAKYNGTGAKVTVNDEASQTADSKTTISEVYGGGYGEGAVTNKADVSIQNGTVTTAYAGGNAAPTTDTQIKVTGGQTDTVFGGGNAATITGSSTVTVNTTDDTQHVDTVFAGNNKASMAIKPTLDFKQGKINTVYCGGNQGVMTYKGDANQGIEYDFDYPNAEIKTVFAGCNNTTETTSDVQLTLISGTYETVYGGNNHNGAMNQTSVVTDAFKDNSKVFKVDTIYGGGNQADAVNTSVTLKNGEVKTVYAGGNAATVTQSAKVNTNGQTDEDHVKVTDLYCGNNEASMAINPTIELTKANITNFYGGGNKGAMTDPDGLTYTLNSKDLTINTIYGGGNEAGVTKSVTLNVEKGNYTDIYGGSNSKGTVDTANVNIKGNVGTTDTNAKVFGGGRGSSTVVNHTNVSLQNGTITGNIYGGSGFGSVGTAKVSAEESTDATVKVIGNIYGAGYGVSSSADDTQVDINLKLSINNDTTGDVQIKEALKSDTDKSGESKATATWNKDYKKGSYISGNVFGGGDMGQVGKGYINTSTNTAVIENGGKTTVNVGSGYIHGNIFGGGNGQPGGKDESGNAITEYTAYMGTVFGSSNVNMTGGYVNGNVFGCGQQSRTYASTDTNNDNQKDASFVNITTDNQKPLLIGESIFGGGNKGNGTTQNASVATVYGDTHVKLKGVENKYTQIYLLSNGTNGGGVYGDGNLCLVSGKKYVTLENFSCGIGKNVNLLKTFYSLQRADVVDIIASRIVLKGAVDLVAENADDTIYSINRASQVNLKKSSTIKVTKTVNLLGELTSDEQAGRQFIDRGNNNGNANITGNDYTGHHGNKPEKPLTKTEVTSYITAYDNYANTGNIFGTYNSINVVCVANGGYLEVKKSASEYGPVTGLFTLQLVNANPGEGGGFIYADIMGKHINDKYVTGNFVCVTKQAENSNQYMYAYHNVGGQFENGKYEYYVWYLKGNKYSYDIDLTSYIGTKDTEFTKTVSLATEPEDYCMILTQLNQTKELNSIDLNKMYQNTWSSDDNASEKFAVEMTLITKSKSDNTINTSSKSIGYIGYQTTSDTDPKAAAKKDSDGKLIWGIWRSDGNCGWKFQSCKGADNSFAVTEGDALATTDSNVVNAQLKFTLHKGTGMTTEFRNLPFEMKIAEAKQADYDKAVKDTTMIEEDSCIRLTTNLNLSAIRLVPTQAAYMGSGRMFAGVSSNSNVNITKTSAFTAQFVTKYIPSAFNTGSTNQIEETLTTKYSDTYLLDENGVGYTIKDNGNGTITVLNVVNSSNPNVKQYKVTKDEDSYKVSYCDENGSVLTDDGKEMTYSCKVEKQSSGFTLPKGTKITLLASLDEQNLTYWYYYCTKDTTDVKLADFKKMNTSNTSTGSGSVYDTIYTTSSSRVTENMIFVFDFEEVSDSDWQKVSNLEGKIQLKHTYNSSHPSVDIMDYVSTESETSGGTTKISYNREMPRQTDTFKISKDSDGITRFNVENADQSSTYRQKDKMKFRLDITPDTTVTNTQYEEREYAVILKLKNNNGEEIAFPEGTVFYYKGKQLATGKDNKYVIVPVSTVGSHEVEIESKLKGFDPNQYELTAALYSTSEEGYYNSIQVEKNADDKTSADFTIQKDPVYALKVTENSASANNRKKNHFASAGESFQFEVTSKGGEADDKVSIGLYQYSNGKYKKVTLSTILEDNAELKTGTMSWNPKVKEGASTGTYRLEFVYHDKTEYWDFMVR